MRKHQEHRVGLLGRIEKYLKNLYLWSYNMTRNFDDERTQKIIGFFCEILQNNNCMVTGIRNKEVDWEFTSGNKKFVKLVGREVSSYDELSPKELKDVRKLERKLGKRWQKKALEKYMMCVSKGTIEEKRALVEDIKAELKDKEDSELKNLVNKV